MSTLAVMAASCLGLIAQTPEFYVDMGCNAPFEGLDCVISESVGDGVKVWNVSVTNNSTKVFTPVKAGIRLGIDTYMDRYPEWLDKYFPTLMYCSKTHFYGYLQTPGGKTMGIVSPDPIASWSLDYNIGYEEPEGYWFYGHRITSVNLDLLNTLPLPEHNPQDRWKLDPGQTQEWKIMFVDLDDASCFESRIFEISSVPMLKMRQTSYSAGQIAEFEVFAVRPMINITDCEGQKVKAKYKKKGNVWKVSCRLNSPGLYRIEITSNGFVTEGSLLVHQSWEWTMRKAREAVLINKQKATSHVESWYGYHTAFIAAKYFPDPYLDSILVEQFDSQMGILYGEEKDKPLHYDWRIQNVSSTIGMYVDKFDAYGDPDDLKVACRLADWLVSNAQRVDGAYVNRWQSVYTSVIYMAKSMLELCEAEKRYALSLKSHGEDDSVWVEARNRHYYSAKTAIDQLVRSNGDFHTEGEITFEDGMVSCSALQMGMLALMQTDQISKQRYTNAMLAQLESHNCLTQLKIPDARRRGGTMRYWESQYDVHIMPNMISSPHGWSAWRAYATYYAYLLTGQEHWLLETWNAMGAFSNLIDYKTGELRWAFIVDPYVNARQICDPVEGIVPSAPDFGNPHPDMYRCREFVVGEQYVSMISSWQPKNSQDNDVHEVFKCLGETFLTNAFVIERANGEFIGYNCTVKKNNNYLCVTPDEPQVTKIHVNFQNPYNVIFNDRISHAERGLSWIE